MSGTLASSHPVFRSFHRAALVTLGLLFGASIGSGAAALHAQGTPQAGQDGPMVRRDSGSRTRMRMTMRRRPGMMMRMMSDPAARLLDEQSLLQLSGDQVSQLIALHETTRRQMKTVTDQLRAMMPKPAPQSDGQAQGPRPRLSDAQRETMATLMDSLRTIRWRATSAADAILTTDQRHAAMRLAMAASHERPRTYRVRRIRTRC